MPRDIIRVDSIPGLEPEEQPVTREVDISVGVRGSLSGDRLGTLGSQVQITESAHEFADNLKRICANCKHFDLDRAQKIFDDKSATLEGRRELRNLEFNLLQTDNFSGAPEDAESTVFDSGMSQLGLCHAISEITKDEMIVHPLGHCPTQTYGDNFRPVDRAAQMRAEKARDRILKQAQGKEPL